jgi:uncharacterized protein (UPF0254 family)
LQLPPFARAVPRTCFNPVTSSVHGHSRNIHSKAAGKNNGKAGGFALAPQTMREFVLVAAAAVLILIGIDAWLSFRTMGPIDQFMGPTISPLYM